MGKQLKVHKVNTLPGTVEADALYIHKDAEGHLLLSQTDNQGVVAFTTMSSEDVYGLIDQKLADSPVVSGARTLNLGQLATYTIINYNSNVEYTVTALSGMVSIEEDTITYQAPASGKVAGFIVNTTIIDITLANPSFIVKPTIASPANNSTEISQNFLIESTAFSAAGETDVHLSTDWQISTDPMFSSLLLFTNNNTTAKVAWNATLLPANTTLYVRVRHKGVNLGLSEWSETSSFTTKTAYVAKPNITSLTNNQTNVDKDITLTSSVFNRQSGVGTHASTDWQLASDESFSSIVTQSIDNATGLTSYDLTNLGVNTSFYVRVRYKTSGGSYSEWSDGLRFTTKTTYDTKPVKPSITSPINNASDLGPELTINSSAFSVVTGTETHVSSDWQVSTDAGFSTIVAQSLNDTNNKVSWYTNGIPVNSTLYLRVRYKGLITSVSDWSDTITIHTKQSYSAAPNVPSITSPVNNATDIASSFNFTSSTFGVSSGVDTHESSSWQIATDSGFTNVIYSTSNNTTNKVSWTQSELPVNTTLYVRVKHTGVYTGESNWSTPVSFTTTGTYITTPSITAPTANAIDQNHTVSVGSSAFASSYSGDTHTSSDWQLSTVSNFASIVSESLNDTTNLTSWSVSSLAENTTYYLRTRRRSTNGGTSAWSTAVAFTTYVKYINTPSITSPTNGATEQGPTVAFTANAFSSNATSQTHLSSDWQIATDSGFTNVVDSLTNDTTNKTGWSSTFTLLADTVYYARVRYKSNSGYTSNWSNSISFSTKETYIATPSITSPTASQTDVLSTHQFTSSAFSSSAVGEGHASSDWEVATDVGFTNIVKTVNNSSASKVTWAPGQLPVNTTLYVRVRHDGDFSNSSEWSTPIQFTTDDTYITTPSITSPANEATNQSNSVNVVSSAFDSNYSGDTHTNSDWQLSTVSNFASIVTESLNDTTNMTTWSVSGLAENTTYYLRTRRRSSNGGTSGWSSVVSFTTYAKYVNAPSITAPTNGVTEQGPTIAFTSNSLSSNVPDQTHESSDWQVATDAGFTNVVASQTDSTTNKVSWTTGQLAVNTVFYARVRYKTVVGYVSNWSSTISFTTKTTYVTTPSVTAPSNGATNQGSTVSYTSSAFASGFTGETHDTSDWQLATDSGFSTIVKSVTNSSTHKVTWSTTELSINTTYYARVRYKGSNGVYSAWSTAISFTTASTFITTPSITAPTNGATDQSNTVSVTSNAFSSTYSGDTHTNSDWQIATNAGFSTGLVESLNDAVNKTSWSVNNLVEGTTYYLRTRRRSANGGVSAWSSTVSFSTFAKYINTPSITTPTNGANNLTPYVAFVSNAFSTNVAGQTHLSSDWQVATDSGFTTVVKSVTDSTGNKTAWTVTDGLPSNTTYYARVRYKSNGGYLSNWSTTIILSTKAYYVTTPSITSPVGGATNLGPTVTITTSAFSSDVTGETHTSTDWQLSTVSDFSSIAFQSLDNTTDKTSWTTPDLAAGTTYYARVRFKGSSSL